MIEPEMAFADLKDDMEVAEAMLKYVISYVMENAPEEMDFLNQFVDKGLKDRLNHVLNSEFGHVTYTEAVEILENITINLNIRYPGVQIYRQNMNVTSQKKYSNVLYL